MIATELNSQFWQIHYLELAKGSDFPVRCFHRVALY